MIDTVVFVHSDQPAIDRGWDTTDVERELSRLGFNIGKIKVKPGISYIRALTGDDGNVLYWPACYTIGDQVDGRLLVDLLEEFHLPYVGASPPSLRLNSKILFKEKLIGTRFSTPAYQILDEGNISQLAIDFPCVIKTEFSANSEGVELVTSQPEAEVVFEALTKRYGQRVFVEAWERETEYTAAFLPTAKPMVAALEMIVVGDKRYIDRIAKADNAYLRFEVPDGFVMHRLTEYVLGIVDFCKLDGHFRLDIIQNGDEQLFPIDLNFLPGMSVNPSQLSYLPMALEMTCGLSFAQVVSNILTYAATRSAIRFADQVAEAIGKTVRST